jgi:hypothetical protein
VIREMKYAVIVEEGETSFGAHVPDLPGCVAVAETKKEVLELIQEQSSFISKVCEKMAKQFLNLLRALNTSRSEPHNEKALLSAGSLQRTLTCAGPPSSPGADLCSVVELN